MELKIENYYHPLSMRCSRHEYWSGLPFPPPGNLSEPGFKPASLSSPAFADMFFTISATWEAPTVQFCSVAQSCLTLCDPWTAAPQAFLSITNSWSLLKLMSTESVMPSNHLILCCPLRLLPSIFPSIRVFSNKSILCIRWSKYWSFSFSISPYNEYSGLISFRMDWLDLLALQGTLKSLLQHHSSKASIFRRSAFFTVQLSHPYMTTGKTIALTRQTFIGKVMSLLFNMLSIRESQIQPTVKYYNTSIGLPRWCPGRGHGNPLQYTCLENPMDRGTWQAAVHRLCHTELDVTEETSHVCTHPLNG